MNIAPASRLRRRIDGAHLYHRQHRSFNSDGELVPINSAAFRKLIDGAICGVRVVSCDGVRHREYYAYAFDPPQRPDARASGPRPQTDENASDSNVVDASIGANWRGGAIAAGHAFQVVQVDNLKPVRRPCDRRQPFQHLRGPVRYRASATDARNPHETGI